MPTTEDLIIRGPAFLEFDSAKFYTKDDIIVPIDPDTFEIPSSLYGEIDQRQKERKAEITFTPVGEIESAQITALFRMLTQEIGSYVFPSVDKPLVITSTDLKQYTFARAAVTKPPQFIAASTKTPFGAVTITALGKIADWSTANSFLDVATVGAFPSVDLDVDKVYTVPWTATYTDGGGTPVTPLGTTIETQDGWVVDFTPKLTDVSMDRYGIINYQLASMSVSAKAKLAGVTEAALLAAMKLSGTGAKRGQSLRSLAAGCHLALTNADVGKTLTVQNAAIRRAPLVFSAENNRMGDIEFLATRNLVAGAMSKAAVWS